MSLQSQQPKDPIEGQPPVFSNWSQWYWVVVVVLIVLMILLSVTSAYFMMP